MADKQLKEIKKKKKKGLIEKVVMGVIVGGAIGSVVGLAVAPKKGTETRGYLKEKSKAVGDKIMHDYGDEIRAAKKSTKKGGLRVWKYIKKKLLKRK